MEAFTMTELITSSETGQFGNFPWSIIINVAYK